MAKRHRTRREIVGYQVRKIKIAQPQHSPRKEKKTGSEKKKFFCKKKKTKTNITVMKNLEKKVNHSTDKIVLH